MRDPSASSSDEFRILTDLKKVSSPSWAQGAKIEGFLATPSFVKLEGGEDLVKPLPKSLLGERPRRGILWEFLEGEPSDKYKIARLKFCRLVLAALDLVFGSDIRRSTKLCDHSESEGNTKSLRKALQTSPPRSKAPQAKAKHPASLVHPQYKQVVSTLSNTIMGIAV